MVGRAAERRGVSRWSAARSRGNVPVDGLDGLDGLGGRSWVGHAANTPAQYRFARSNRRGSAHEEISARSCRSRGVAGRVWSGEHLHAGRLQGSSDPPPDR